jgi:nucleoside-diphosphate-sugar epimerase
MTARTALVTGTGGFLGLRIAQRLRAAGWRISELKGRRELTALDSRADVAPDVVVHAAFGVDFSPARKGEESESVATTRRLLAWASERGAPRFVFLSAAGALGVSAIPRARSETSLGSTDAGFEDYRDTRYVQDKLLCEELLAAYGGATAVIYPTTVYGLGMNASTLRPLRALRGLSPFALVPPGGTSFLHVDDFLDALETVLDRGARGGFVVSSGNVTYRGLYEAALVAMGIAGRKRVVALPVRSWPLLRRAAAFRKTVSDAVLASSFGFKYYSCEKARRELGWFPKRTLTAALQPLLCR